ncbi:MAG: PEP-CTERM sorting domain-containing protein [Phycisphaerales bacterium]
MTGTRNTVSGLALTAVVAVGLGGLVGGASAVTIDTGTYRLHNHPDGNAVPPPYGARLDELFNVTGGHDIFTFDFDHASSAMFLDYDGTSIHIYGQAYGGRDIGGTYAADVYQALYTFDFTYSLNVGPVPGDDDVYVSSDAGNNQGVIGTPLGPINLYDKSDGNHAFRFGDENNDLGHRGFNGISGWGWLMAGDPNTYIESNDWIFTAELVPAPGTLGLALGGMLMAGRRRRK